MTPSEVGKRTWLWVELHGYRVCNARGCDEQIRRITWIHPREREAECSLPRHVAPLPLHHRCYLCGAATHDREQSERRLSAIVGKDCRPTPRYR